MTVLALLPKINNIYPWLTVRYDHMQLCCSSCTHASREGLGVNNAS